MTGWDKIKAQLEEYNMSKWDRLKTFIASHNINSTISRQDIRNYVERGYIEYAARRGCTLYVPSTVDSYINILTKIGILEKIKPGRYKILYYIKPDVSISEAKEAASNWRSWFNDFKIKE